MLTRQNKYETIIRNIISNISFAFKLELQQLFSKRLEIFHNQTQTITYQWKRREGRRSGSPNRLLPCTAKN